MNLTENKKGQLEEGYKLGPAGEIIPDYDTTLKFFDEGDVIEGTVVKIDRDEVLVDVGYKSEGVIPLKELSIKSIVNPNDVVKEGDEIKAVVLQKEDSEGRLILSKKRADFEKAWEDIETANKENKTISGKVIEIVKGGLILHVGVRGFLPASLIELNRVKSLDQYVNQELECKIIEVNRNRNNVVLSRKAVLNNEQRSEKQKVLEKLAKGQSVKGQVSSIVDFGAFVDLGGVDGLIHISEISWEHVNHPSEVLSVGQEIEVQVLEIDNRKSRVSLGLKQTQDDPWKDKLEGYEVGTVIKGKVTKILPFGVFTEFDELEGLIHISELAPGKVVNPKEVVEIGQEIETKIIGIDVSRRRISLSAKQLQESDERREVRGEDKEGESKEESTETPEPEKVEEEKVTAEGSHPEKAEAKEEQAVEEKVEKAKPEKVEKEEVVEEVKAEEKADEQKEAEKSDSAKATPDKTPDKEEKKKPITAEDEALLEKLAQGPTKIEDEAVDGVPSPNSLEDVLEQMKKSHGAKK